VAPPPTDADESPAPARGSAFLCIVASGIDAVRRSPLRNAVTAACVVALLVPYLVGIGIAQGLADQVAASAGSGPDLYVRGEEGGIDTSLPSAARAAVAAVPGVAAVTPRIVAPVTLGRRSVPLLLVGLPPEALAARGDSIRGRLPRDAEMNEVVLGAVAARDLALDVGSVLPPFYRSGDGERVTTVVGVLSPDAPEWQSRLMLTTLATAEHVLDHDDLATDLLVSCDDTDIEAVAVRLRRLEPVSDAGRTMRLHVTTRTDATVLGLGQALHAEAIYHALFALALAMGVPLVLVTSGIGLPERRREIGLLRATGWRMDEVLLRSVVENATVATIAAAAAIGITWAWLALLDGWGVAPVFFPGATLDPGFAIPYRVAPFPILLGLALAHAFVLIGSLSATWRAAAVPPAKAMR
jgi:ABC-type lipoprotein release transport system permease subunit